MCTMIRQCIPVSAFQEHWLYRLNGAIAMRGVEFDGTRFGGDDSHRKHAGMIGAGIKRYAVFSHHR